MVHLHGPTEEDWLRMGMQIAGVFRWERCKRATNIDRFRTWYGTHPAACQRCFDDLLNSEDPNDAEIRVDMKKDKPMHFLLICRFLWLYPSEINLGQFFRIWSATTVYKYVKLWLKRMAWMMEKKLGSLNEYDVGLTILFTLDCTMCRTEEPRPFSTDNSAFKFGGKPGVNYEIALLIHKPKVIWIHGPKQPGKYNDLEVFRMKLKQEMMEKLPGRKGLADKGYKGEEDLLCMRNEFDPTELAEYKDRSLARQEVFNGFLKKFEVLRGTWRHIKISHGDALRACCLLTQYQLDAGTKHLFDPYP